MALGGGHFKEIWLADVGRGYISFTDAPQVMQWRHPGSTSLRHSGQWVSDCLWPQWGQNLTTRAPGRTSPQ